LFHFYRLHRGADHFGISLYTNHENQQANWGVGRRYGSRLWPWLKVHSGMFVGVLQCRIGYWRPSQRINIMPSSCIVGKTLMEPRRTNDPYCQQHRTQKTSKAWLATDPPPWLPLLSHPSDTSVIMIISFFVKDTKNTSRFGLQPRRR
jgi:hypothetical protein